MLATDVGTRSIPSVRDVDNSLFDYDIGDVFRDVDTNMDVLAVQKPVARADGNENGAGLGIDEEIRMIKKRVPVPKMDENRFVFDMISRVARLLNEYQAPVTCWHSKATENCNRAIEVQGERARSISSDRDKKGVD